MDETTIDPGEIAELWAAARVSYFARDFPEYGSRPWRELPPDDPKRLAAALEAAECWRRHLADQAHLDALYDADPAAWWRAVTADADIEAQRAIRRLQPGRNPTFAEVAARRCAHPPRPLQPTAGWPPIAIPGQPGRHLTHREAA